MTVDPAFVEWLRASAYFASAVDASQTAKWGDLAIESEIVSCIAEEADAEDEGDRQLAFMAGPIAIDRHPITGKRVDLIGEAVTLTIDRLGYGAGVACFVIGAEEAEDEDITTLTVLRPL